MLKSLGILSHLALRSQGGQLQERMQAKCYRRKRKLRLAKVEICESEIAHLARLGHEVQADDPQSLGSAITSFLADAALNSTNQI